MTGTISPMWQSTNNPNGPQCEAKENSFRDIPLDHFDIMKVDRIDAACQRLEISRSTFLSYAVAVALDNEDKLLQSDFILAPKKIIETCDKDL